jgi:hypothetical protein
MSIESERARQYAQRSGQKGSLDELINDNKKLVDENLRLTAIIEGLLGTEPQANPVRLILISKNTSNNSILRIMALNLAANQEAVGVPSLLDDTTQQPVTSTFANTAAVSDTPTVLTAAIDSNGNVDATAVAAGSGNLTVTTTATYTNSLGNQVVSQESVVIPFTVTPVVTADQVSLVVTFGAPVTQPVSL